MICAFLPLRAITAPVTFGNVDEKRLEQADSSPENWYSIDRDSASDHFSPLKMVNEANVGRVGFAWLFETETKTALEASPVVIDGVMYTTGTWGIVYALNAETGKLIWRFDPKVDGKWARRACCNVVNRGVAVWKGLVYVASLDGRLFALDARSGDMKWVQDTLIDHNRYQTVTGAPQIAGDKVVIGNAGGEFGVRGYVSAYDVKTGAFAWRFFTVPGDPKKPYESADVAMAAKTWDSNTPWEFGGGGAPWGPISYDPKLDLVYLGTGNGTPDAIFARSPKRRDTLFVSSILAIHGGTGRLAWYYQPTPGDSWDFDNCEQLTFADLKIHGALRHVVMQASKNGFYFVLDRSTGELISADKYGEVNWASHIDLKTGRPVLTGDGDFSKEPKLVYPGQAGAHNWRPMSYSPVTKLTYIPTIQWPMLYRYHPSATYQPGKENSEVDVDEGVIPVGQTGVIPIVTKMDYLQAYDPVAQKMVWRIVTSDIPEETGGVLSTAGNLVVQGDSTGFVNFYSATTGTPLVRINVGKSIMAAPVTYAVNGVQYIAFMAGPPRSAFYTTMAAYRYGDAGRVVVLKLDGGPVPLPPVIDRSRPPEPPPSVRSSPQMIEHGRELFASSHCSSCHHLGVDAIAPNLLAMPANIHAVFNQIVLNGLLQANGMASFSDILTESDVDDIHAYLVDAARQGTKAASRQE
jgi:quinohemoprotein ethanol dehydrogenase